MTAAQNQPAVVFNAVNELTIGTHVSGLHVALLVEKADDAVDFNIPFQRSDGGAGV